MDLFEAIQSRRSIRNYQDKPVEDEKLQQILNAARLAPSARNRQEWQFVVIRDTERRKELSLAAKNQSFVAEAPVVIGCCGEGTDYVMTSGHPAYLIDLAIAIDHMTLAATALGLGTCWIGAFYQEQVKRILKIPESVAVVELMTLGYPKEIPPAKSRKSLSEIVRYETWKTI